MTVNKGYFVKDTMDFTKILGLNSNSLTSFLIFFGKKRWI